jgi:hypothetical protein
LLGATRWDAWQENGDIQATVERSLGPNHWHYRLPFFARVTGSNSVTFTATPRPSWIRRSITRPMLALMTGCFAFTHTFGDNPPANFRTALKTTQLPHGQF